MKLSLAAIFGIRLHGPNNWQTMEKELEALTQASGASGEEEVFYVQGFKRCANDALTDKIM